MEQAGHSEHSFALYTTMRICIEKGTLHERKRLLLLHYIPQDITGPLPAIKRSWVSFVYPVTPVCVDLAAKSAAHTREAWL